MLVFINDFPCLVTGLDINFLSLYVHRHTPSTKHDACKHVKKRKEELVACDCSLGKDCTHIETVLINDKSELQNGDFAVAC